MDLLAVVLTVGGALVMMVGAIWLLVVAFHESVFWGLACLLCSPIGPLLFLLTHRQGAVQPFLTYLFGALVMIGGVSSSEELRKRLPDTWDARAPVSQTFEKSESEPAPVQPDPGARDAQPPGAAPRMYRWTDASGVVHYTDDFRNIPERYREHAQTTLGDDIMVLESPSGRRSTPAPHGQARAQAPREGSVRLLLFRADWCPACRKLDSSGTIQKFAAQHPDVPVVRVDVDREVAQAQRYRIASIPAVVLVDSSGNELARPGVPSSLANLESALARARKR